MLRLGIVGLFTVAIALHVRTGVVAAPLQPAPNVFRDVAPSALTARFEQCMYLGASPRSTVPSIAGCLAALGFADRAGLQEQAALCLRREGIARTVCLNRMFAALTPASLTSPTATPTRKPASPAPTTYPVPTASPAPSASPATRPSALPVPTVPPAPQPCATPTRSAISVPTPLPPTATPAPAPTATPTPTGFPPAGVAGALTLAGAAILASGIIIYRRRKGRQRMLQLTILAPANGSIAVAGAPVRFTAQTDPKQLAAKIVWSVADRPDLHGSGDTFDPSFSVTGIERIVAQIPDLGLACDSIVYVFKTPSGGSTAADILRAEPPPVAREVELQPQFGSHASAIARAS